MPKKPSNMPLYSELEKLNAPTTPPSAPIANTETPELAATQKVTQKPTQVSKRSSKSLLTQETTQPITQISTQKVTRLSNPVSKRLLNQPTMEEIEDLHYRLRKVNKVRVNADVPAEWKDRLNDLAHELGVGKYELMLYIIGTFLGEADRLDDSE